MKIAAVLFALSFATAPYYEGEVICQHTKNNPNNTVACAVMRNNQWVAATAKEVENAKQKRKMMFVTPNHQTGLEPMPDLIPNDKKD